MITTQIPNGVRGAVIIFNKILIIERNWSIFKFNSLAFFVMLGKFVCSCKVAIVFLALSKKRISSIQHTIKQNIKHNTQQFFFIDFYWLRYRKSTSISHEIGISNIKRCQRQYFCLKQWLVWNDSLGFTVLHTQLLQLDGLWKNCQS